MRNLKLTGAVAPAALVAAMVAFGAPGFAQVPVTDSAVISASNKIASNTQEQLKILKDIKGTTEEILEALGNQGQGQYDLNKNQDWKEFSGGGELLTALEQFGPNACALTGCKDAKALEFKDLAAARAYVMQNLYGKAVGSRADKLDYEALRQNAEREANVSGYALSLVARQYLADAGERAKKLDGIVNSADDVRADLRANSAVSLVQHQELTAMLAIMTSMLERDATGFLAHGENDYVSAEGGNKPADAHFDADYQSDGQRVGVNGSAAKNSQDVLAGGGGANLPNANGGNQTEENPLTKAAKATGNDSTYKVFEQSQSTYGNDNEAVALGAAAEAAGMDGNADSQAALEAAAQRAAQGAELGNALFGAAAGIASNSSNESLKWMFESAQYGMGGADWYDAVDVASGQRPMLDVMFDVAGNMASESQVTGSSEILSQAQSALANGTIDAQQAAMVALQVAADASGHAELSPLLSGAADLAGGSTPQDVLVNVVRGSGENGSNVANVLDVLTSVTW